MQRDGAPGIRTRDWLTFAAWGAVLASVGDVAMLTVALGKVPLADPGAIPLLIAGGILGVAGIPFYYAGYLAVLSQTARDDAPGGTPAYRTVAVGVALFGTLTHGLTAWDIHEALAAGAATRPPDAAFAQPSLLVAAAVIAAISCVSANAIMLRSARSGRDRAILVGANPLAWTIVLAAAAPFAGDAGAFLGPSAPNIGHAIFFAACLRLR